MSANPSLKKDHWGGEFWTDGYYVATVGDCGSWSVVERYFKDQGRKDNVQNLRLWYDEETGHKTGHTLRSLPQGN